MPVPATALSGGQQLVPGQSPDGEWWKQFHMPALDALVATALQDSPCHRRAPGPGWLRLAEDSSAAEAALLPQLNLAGGRGTELRVSQRSPLNVTLPPFEYYAAGPSASFPLDLFGGGKRTAERAAAFAEYQQHELDAAALSLFANLTAQAIRNAAARAQIANLQHVIADDGAMSTWCRARWTPARRPAPNCSVCKASWPPTAPCCRIFASRKPFPATPWRCWRARRPAAGHPPSFALDDFTLPEEIPASLPSELIHHRPDILAAEAQLHMASAAIGVATANLYPQLNLSAQLGAGSPDARFAGQGCDHRMGHGGNLPSLCSTAASSAPSAGPPSTPIRLLWQTIKKPCWRHFGDVADHLQALANDAERWRGNRSQPHGRRGAGSGAAQF